MVHEMASSFIYIYITQVTESYDIEKTIEVTNYDCNYRFLEQTIKMDW